jgi:hypothetical protein
MDFALNLKYKRNIIITKVEMCPLLSTIKLQRRSYHIPGVGVSMTTKGINDATMVPMGIIISKFIVAIMRSELTVAAT